MQAAAGGGFAAYLKGYLDANGIPVKRVVALRGLDASYFSKKTNNPQLMTTQEAFLIGVATGAARAEGKTRK